MRDQNIIDELKTIQKDIIQLKSSQNFGGDNTVVYSGSDTTGDSSASGRYGYSIFTATTSSVELIASIFISWGSSNPSDPYTVSDVSATMAQVSTDKDVAKYDSSWMVFWSKAGVVPGFTSLTISGTIITRTPNTVTATSHGTGT